MLGVKPTEALATELGFKRVGTTVVSSDGGISAIVTEPRDLPAFVPERAGVDAKIE